MKKILAIALALVMTMTAAFAMADAIHSIVTNDAFAEYLKVEGKKEVDEIKWEYAGDKVINVYNQVLGYK